MVLKVSLLLILGMVVLECEAKPAEPSTSVVGAAVKDSPLDPVQETKAELDNPLTDSLSLTQRRLKRGIEGGMSCEEFGQGKLEIQNTFDRLIKNNLSEEAAEKAASDQAQEDYGFFCKSEKCYYDKDKKDILCRAYSENPNTGNKFEDGRNCENGASPKDVSPEEKAKIDAFLSQAGSDRDGAEKGFSRYGNDLYGRNCKSGKCYFDSRNGLLVCGSKSKSKSSSTLIQPFATLIAALLGTPSLRIL